MPLPGFWQISSALLYGGGVGQMQIYYKGYRHCSQNRNPPCSMAPSPHLTFRSLVTAQTTLMPAETCMIPFSDPGGSTIDQELPSSPRETPGVFVSQDTKGKAPIPGPGGLTFRVVPADSFPDQGLALPEGGPQEVVGPTTDLDHLRGSVYQGP
jgi:hypothetical protein